MIGTNTEVEMVCTTETPATRTTSRMSGVRSASSMCGVGPNLDSGMVIAAIQDGGCRRV